MKKMKIVLVSYHYWPPDFGGELIVSIERFQSLFDLGHEVTVLTSGLEGFPMHEISNGLNINRGPQVAESKFARGIRRLIFPFWVVAKIWRHHFDILHLADAGGVDSISKNLGGWMICRFAKLKKIKIVFVHSLADTEDEMFSEKGFDRLLRKFYLDQCDSIVSVSPALHTAVEKIYPNTSCMIPYGVRDDIFMPLTALERNENRIQLGLDPRDIVFTFLGTVGYRKGFDLLADVFLENIDQHPNWHLWVIGPISKKDNQNVNEKEVMTLISPLQHRISNVRFWGRINDRKELSRLLAMSDTFVFPSRKEGFGIAPLEAMCVGVPVIVSRIPGVTDLANIDQVTGLYVDVGNKASLKHAMETLANDPDLRIHYGKSAHKRITSDFGWRSHIQVWESMYSSLLGTK